MEEKYPKPYLRELAHKWKTGKLTAQEQSELDKWYNSHNDERLELSQEFIEHPYLLKDRITERVLARIHNQPLARKAKVFRSWQRITVAASIILCLGIGFFSYQYNHKRINETSRSAQNDIAPGKQGATLTLANGKKINLSDANNGELAEQSGVVITKSGKGQLTYDVKGAENKADNINTLSTSNGETYQVRLPDGSHVWLNAASSLTYAANLGQSGKRMVKFEGEGYFEIAKDKLHPFVVTSGDQQVEVLGTHFNINSYKDEPNITTTLLEGSVKIRSLHQLSIQHDVVLKPRQQASLAKGDFHITQADIEEVIAWKDGYFRFKEEPLESIMRKISRWYNVEVIYASDVPKDITLIGVVSRNKSISSVLKSIALTEDVKFKVEGKRITVLKHK